MTKMSVSFVTTVREKHAAASCSPDLAMPAYVSITGGLMHRQANWMQRCYGLYQYISSHWNNYFNKSHQQTCHPILYRFKVANERCRWIFITFIFWFADMSTNQFASNQYHSGTFFFTIFFSITVPFIWQYSRCCIAKTNYVITSDITCCHCISEAAAFANAFHNKYSLPYQLNQPLCYATHTKNTVRRNTPTGYTRYRACQKHSSLDHPFVCHIQQKDMLHCQNPLWSWCNSVYDRQLPQQANHWKIPKTCHLKAPFIISQLAWPEYHVSYLQCMHRVPFFQFNMSRVTYYRCSTKEAVSFSPENTEDRNNLHGKSGSLSAVFVRK